MPPMFFNKRTLKNGDLGAHNMGLNKINANNDDASFDDDDTYSDTTSQAPSAISDASRLTIDFLRFSHTGWSYHSYLDNLERIQRAPLKFRALQSDYREERRKLGETFSKILSGAKERREYFATCTPLSKEKLDDEKVHRLWRDSIRRRYEHENVARSHDAGRAQYLAQVADRLSEAQSDAARRELVVLRRVSLC